MVILALDLAGQTGFAIAYDTGHIEVGTWDLSSGEIGGVRSPIPMLRLWEKLNEFAAENEVGTLVIEETFARGAAKFRLDSLQCTAILFAMLNNIPFSRLSPGQWKKAVVGKGNATKEDYLAFARERWPQLNLKNDDEAAARCLLQYALNAADLPSCAE